MFDVSHFERNAHLNSFISQSRWRNDVFVSCSLKYNPHWWINSWKRHSSVNVEIVTLIP